MRILLVVYDNDTYMSYFPIGTAYIAAVIRQKGYEVEIYNQDVWHYPNEHLTKYLKENHFDVVGVKVIGGYWQYRQLLATSKAINAVPNRPVFILGGQGPSPEPEYFLEISGADIVCIGESEISLPNLLSALGSGRSLSSVRGIVYKDDGKYIHTQRENVIKDIDSIPMPAWDLFPMTHYSLFRFTGEKPNERTFPVLTGRGCLYKCNFCYRIETGYRGRSAGAIIEEIKKLKKDYRISFFAFADELFMSTPDRTRELCEEIISSGINIKFFCNGRLNIAHIDLLQLMKRAGCVFINYGIESLDDNVLEIMNKQLTVNQIVGGIENTIAAGIHPGFNIIFGNIGETKEILMKGVDFLLKYNTYSQLRTIRPVTPYPGSPLYYYAIKEGLLEGPKDFYERKHINEELLAVNFTEMTDEEFHNALAEANEILIRDYYKAKCADTLEEMRKLYLKQNNDFRGFRQT